MIKFSYEKQAYEKQKTKLIEHKQQIMQALQEAQNRTALLAYARIELKMEEVRLDQIKVVHCQDHYLS